MESRPNFLLFRSSAGSGKTYNLAREYLKLALGSPDKFKHILAVTFTNKATNEMKSRIISELFKIVKGEGQTPMAKDLSADLNLDQLQIQEKALLVLRSILHDYSHFAVSTIDSFFQKVITGFAREIRLQGGFQVDLDLERALSEATDLMFLELDKDPVLLRWLVQFSQSRLEEEKSWDIRNDILSLGKEIFKESFKNIQEKLVSGEQKPETVEKLRDKLGEIKFTFENDMKRMALELIGIIRRNGYSVEDFSYGKSGVAGYIFGIVDRKHYEYGKRAKKGINDPEAWITANSPKRPEMLVLVMDQLISRLLEITKYYDSRKTLYYSANEIYRFLYTFGLLSYLVDKLRNYREDHSVVLISDLSVLLKAIIGNNDTPFIYEKVGIYFDHFLIDEFQDTSTIQWNNFSPLVRNSLAQNSLNMAVGDVKQSIYRWRGGDWRILDYQVEEDIGIEYIHKTSLLENWRSSKNIIGFNNAFFSAASHVISDFLENKAIEEEKEDQFDVSLLEKAYADITQKIPDGKMEIKDGYVRIQFIPDREKGDGEDQDNFKEKVLKELPSFFEKIQDSGISISDLAIIVRNNNEGKEVANYMLRYSGSVHAKKGYRYDVISSESLILGASVSVKTLISAIQFLVDPMNDLARLNLVYYYKNALPPEKDISYDEIFQLSMAAQNNHEILSKILPEIFIDRIAEYKGMPVNELISSLISDLGLNTLAGEFSYLLGFQDAVQEFSMKERSDIRNFLDWWDEKGSERSITLPQNQEAAKILTIHKSKGLEFRIVLIPFCDWKMEPDGTKDNILWVDAGKTIHDIPGPIPVKYSSRLATTFYEEEYYQEKLLSFIDNLNLTYVAFTRAAEALVVFAPAIPNPEKGVKPDKAGNLVMAVLKDIQNRSGDFDIHGIWDDQNQVYTLGEFPGSEPAVPGIDEISLDVFASSPWHSKISFHKIADNAFTTDIGGTAKKNTGIAIHDILSRIIMKEDLDKVFKQVITEGIINSTQEDEIKESVRRLWENPVVSEWFSGTWTVKTEAPVIPAPGELNRMDRVMIRDKKAIVVDYKTGKPGEKDIRQVKEYLRILANMEYAEVEGYLLYIDEAKLVKVQ